MNRFLILLIVTLLVVGLSCASGIGQTAISVFDIEPGVRALGIGGAAVALADGPETLYYNAAGLAELTGIGFTSSYTFHLGVAGYSALAVASRYWGVGLLALNSGNITGYDADGNSTDNLTYGNTAALLGFGVDPKQLPFIPALPIDFRAGGCFKYLSVRNGNTNGSGFALNLAFRMDFPDVQVGPIALSDLGVGATATNLLGQLSYPDRNERFRMDLRVGGSARVAGLVLLCADLELGGSFHVGTEYWLTEAVALRAGVLTEPGATSLTIGMGFRLEGFVIDYGFISHPTLSGSHRLSLTIDFSTFDLGVFGRLANSLRRMLPF